MDLLAGHFQKALTQPEHFTENYYPPLKKMGGVAKNTRVRMGVRLFAPKANAALEPGNVGRFRATQGIKAMGHLSR